MMAIYFSVPFNWCTQFYSFGYLVIIGIDWTDYESILLSIALFIWMALTFIWQIFLVPPTVVWYRLARINRASKYYATRGLNDIQTPDLDNLSYLDKPLREAWLQEQENLKEKKKEKKKLEEQTRIRREKQAEAER